MIGVTASFRFFNIISAVEPGCNPGWQVTPERVPAPADAGPGTNIGCKIWNDFWSGWPTGTAVRMYHSPRFAGEQNLFFRQEHAFWLYRSPEVRLIHNTCVSNLYSGAAFYHSVRGSV